MILSLSPPAADAVSIGDFIEHLKTKVDVNDPQSLIEAAPMLRALARDRRPLLDAMHQQMRERFAMQRVPSSQVVVLGGGSDCYVRVDLWPTETQARNIAYQEQAGVYRVAIGQSFTTMLTNYFGSGLVHDLFHYDAGEIQGFPGEAVNLSFSERLVLDDQAVAVFTPHGELIQRRAPESFTATLGVFVLKTTGDMHMVDVNTKKLAALSPQVPGSRRAALIALAGAIGDDETREHLDAMRLDHECWQTRLAANQALAQLSPDRADVIWTKASADDNPVIQRNALDQLRGRERG